jgi:hypothetical protein
MAHRLRIVLEEVGALVRRTVSGERAPKTWRWGRSQTPAPYSDSGGFESLGSVQNTVQATVLARPKLRHMKGALLHVILD